MTRPPTWTAEEWEVNNPLLLARDEYRCACCGVPLRGRVERHHRQRRAVGGDRFANLICLLPWHHMSIHSEPERARARGWIVSSYEEHLEDVPILLWGSTWMLLHDDTSLSQVVHLPAL